MPVVLRIMGALYHSEKRNTRSAPEKPTLAAVKLTPMTGLVAEELTHGDQLVLSAQVLNNYRQRLDRRAMHVMQVDDPAPAGMGVYVILDEVVVFLAPILGIDIPQRQRQGYMGTHLRIDRTVRRPEPARRRHAGRYDSRLRPAYLVADLTGAKPRQVGMIPAMVADLVALLMDPANDIRMSGSPGADQEERGVRLMLR